MDTTPNTTTPPAASPFAQPCQCGGTVLHCRCDAFPYDHEDTQTASEALQRYIAPAVLALATLLLSGCNGKGFGFSEAVTETVAWMDSAPHFATGLLGLTAIIALGTGLFLLFLGMVIGVCLGMHQTHQAVLRAMDQVQNQDMSEVISQTLAAALEARK